MSRGTTALRHVAERTGPGPLQNRVALVTGSSHGIGAVVAATFADLGARVVVHGRDRAAAERVASTIRTGGGTASVALGDVTDPDDLVALRRNVETEMGPVEILVANAGGSLTPPAPVEDIPVQGWRDTIEGNLTATFLTVRCFVPGMRKRRRGVIITIGSSAGRQANSRVPLPYGAAKAGIALMTRNLAVQLGPAGIRANCIAPETILTDANRARIPPGTADGHRRAPSPAAPGHAGRRGRGRLPRLRPIVPDHRSRPRRHRWCHARLGLPEHSNGPGRAAHARWTAPVSCAATRTAASRNRLTSAVVSVRSRARKVSR